MIRPHTIFFSDILFIAVALLLLVGSCHKIDIFQDDEEDPITLAKAQFQKDSRAFVRSGKTVTYNFRQSLTREVEWDDSYSKDDMIIAPITQILPDDMVTEDGKRTLDHAAWLVIRRDSTTGDYSYEMITVIDEGEGEASGFSGIVLFEDYFVGNVLHAVYEDGKVLPKHITRRANRTTNEKMASSGGCSWAHVATVCVGDVGNDGSPEICDDRYELVCERMDQPMLPIDVRVGSGGSNGSPPNQKNGLKTNKLSNEDKQKLKDAIDDAKQRNCAYKALMETMEKSGNISFVVDANRNVGGGGGTYFANTKDVVYAGSFAVGHVGLLTHETFHAFQHQSVYGPSFGNYSTGKAGNINIEFEQIVFQDIAMRASGDNHGVGEMFNQRTKDGYGTTLEDYNNWINILTTNCTIYPNLKSRPNFDTEFCKHLDNFLKYGHEGYTTSAQKSNSLKPEALKKDGTLNCNK